MRILTLHILALLLLSCGSDDDAIAKIGWQLNYKDRTDADASNDIRECSNAGQGYVDVPYRSIDKVRILMEDPEGLVPGIDLEFGCNQGSGGKRVPISGIVRQVFALNIEAKTADGTVLYRHEDPEYDVSKFREDTFTLETTTGEKSFFPAFDTSSVCPVDVAKIEWSMLRKDGSTVADTPEVTGVVEAACDSDLPNQIVIREVPVILEEPRQTTNSYCSEVRALSGSGATLFCSRQGRSVRLGKNTLNNNQNLELGACAPSDPCPDP
ncbi:hypothetical protein ACFL6C_09300 [Myxococcota bacterium]